jgi:hypothetical protein
MLVDSGAMHSIVDGETLRKLGIRPTGTRTFILADGTEVIRRVGTGSFDSAAKKQARSWYSVNPAMPCSLAS